MNLIQCFQTHSTWYKGSRRNGKPVGILWHDTAAGNPNISPIKIIPAQAVDINSRYFSVTLYDDRGDISLKKLYKHKDREKIRQYELENFVFLYKAYKALKGNSFIDKIYNEVMTWEVIT